MKSGMKFLIESFYRSITDGAGSPLSYREISLTADIMDAIFDQLSASRAAKDRTVTPARRALRRAKGRALAVPGVAGLLTRDAAPSGAVAELRRRSMRVMRHKSFYVARTWSRRLARHLPRMERARGLVQRQRRAR